jgi:hypothetical protein
MRHAPLTAITRLISISIVALVAIAAPRAERMGYPPEEFTARREKLAKSLKAGTLVMFGATAPNPGMRFRQDNDFYYLTGTEAHPERRGHALSAQAERRRGPLRRRQLARGAGRREEVRVRLDSAAQRPPRVPGAASRHPRDRDAVDAAV